MHLEELNARVFELEKHPSGGGLTPVADKAILSNISGASAVPIGNTLSALIDSIFGSTQGQILTRNGSVWTVINPGTAGYYLTSGGSGANVSYTAPLITSLTTTGSGAASLAGGVLNIPTPTGSSLSVVQKTVDYTFVLADANKIFLHPTSDTNARTFSLPNNTTVAFPVGTELDIINRTTPVVAVAVASPDVLTFAATATTGVAQLALNAWAKLVKDTSTTWMIQGPGVTRLGAILDNYTVGLFAAYGYKLLITAYYGSPILKLRRSSDSAMQDFGVTSIGLLDTAAVLAWAGSDTVTVVRAYDQSGNGNHFDAPASAQEPRVATGGVMDGFLYFDGTDDNLLCINNAATGSNKSIARSITMRSTPAVSFVYEYGDGSKIGSSTSGQTAIQEYPGGSGSATNCDVYMGSTAASSYSYNRLAAVASGTWVHVFRPGTYSSTSAIASLITGYRAGAAVSSTTTGFGSTGAASTFSALKYRFGKRTDGNPAPMNMAWAAMWDADKTTDAASISNLT